MQKVAQIFISPHTARLNLQRSKTAVPTYLICKMNVCRSCMKLELAYMFMCFSDLWTLICFHHISSTHSFSVRLAIPLSFSLSLSALSVSSIMMLIKWAEWIIQIPMAGCLPSALSPAPLCLLEGIIHLALSLYTHAILAHTHRPCKHTLILIRGLFTWPQGKVKRWETHRGIAGKVWKLKPTCDEEDQTQKVDRKKESKQASSKCFPNVS